MNPKLRTILIIIGLVTLLLLGIFVVPRGLSLYFQTRGGQHVEYVLRASEGVHELICEQLLPTDQEGRNEVEQAVVDLNRALRFNRSNSQAYYYLGKVNCLLGDAESAVEYYQSYIVLKPSNPLGYIGLGFAYERLGKKDLAVEAWKAGDLGTDDFLDVGRQALRDKKFDDAMKWYGIASHLSPNDGRVSYEIGLLFEEVGDWNSALITYNQALTNKSSDMIGLSSLYYRIGRIYSERLSVPDLLKAIESFTDAIEKDDFYNDWEKSDSNYRLGVILRNEGNPPEDFLAYFEQAREIYPKHVFASILLGVTYYAIDTGDLRAEEAIQFALDLDPNNKWGYFHLGEIYRKEGRIEESIAIFEKALTIDPSFERAQRSLQSILSENQTD